jgi:hypothetical protein
MIRNPAYLWFSGLVLFVILNIGCSSRPNPTSPSGGGGGGATAKESAPGDRKGINAGPPSPPPPPPIKGAPKTVARHYTGKVPLAQAPLVFAPLGAAPSVDPEVAWFSKLQNGLLKQYVPPTMQWKVSSSVTVVVGGEKADASSALPNATGSSPIKVSRQMKVIVFCPDNPDEFTIAAEPGTQEVQYVPEDGATTWNYSVTPKYTGKNQKIAIRAWVIYPGSSNADHELPVYTAVVNVRVPSIGECIKRLVEGDPDYWVKYGLPGGAGFIFVSGIATGIWKWLRKKKARGAAPEPVGS